SVGSAPTSAPSATRPRTRWAILYAAMPPPTPTRTRAPSRGREVVHIMVPRALGCRRGARPGRGSEEEVRRRHLGGVVAELQRGRSVRIGLLRRVVLVLVDLADGQQPLVDLAQRDRQGLLLVLHVDQG